MALTIAIGELQSALGPDQRITASGGILAGSEGDSSVANAHWTGVWDSWKAETRESVDGYSRHQTIEGRSMGKMAPTYVEGREDHFRSWLVSLSPDARKELSSAINVDLAGDTTAGEAATAVRLVGEGSVEENKGGEGGEGGATGAVHAQLLKTETGRYAWWVGDESQKARIMHDTYLSDEPSSPAERLFRHQAPDRPGRSPWRGLKILPTTPS